MSGSDREPETPGQAGSTEEEDQVLSDQDRTELTPPDDAPSSALADEHWERLNVELRWHVNHELDQHGDWEIPGAPDRHSRAWANLRRVEFGWINPNTTCLCLHTDTSHPEGSCHLCDCPTYMGVSVARDLAERYQRQESDGEGEQTCTCLHSQAAHAGGGNCNRCECREHVSVVVARQLAERFRLQDPEAAAEPQAPRVLQVDLARFTSAGIGTVWAAAAGLTPGQIVHLTDDDADTLVGEVVSIELGTAVIRVRWDQVVRRAGDDDA